MRSVPDCVNGRDADRPCANKTRARSSLMRRVMWRASCGKASTARRVRPARDSSCASARLRASTRATALPVSRTAGQTLKLTPERSTGRNCGNGPKSSRAKCPAWRSARARPRDAMRPAAAALSCARSRPRPGPAGLREPDRQGPQRCPGRGRSGADDRAAPRRPDPWPSLRAGARP